MNLAFLLPAGLAALGALLVPLLIHLARHSEQRPTTFAALQWLRQASRPRHRVRFDEWPLLLVRLLLLVLLALLLARPVLFGSADSHPRVAVVAGVDLQQARDQSVPPGARWLWLSLGFPAFDGAPQAGAGASSPESVTSLLRELDASLAPGVALTVLVPERLDGVDAERPVLSRQVDWRVLPGAMPNAPAVPVETAPTLVVRYAPQRESSVRYLRAADAAWRETSAKTTATATADSQDIERLSQPLDRRSRHLAWLAPGPLPQPIAAWVRDGGTILLDAQATLADAPTMVALWRDDAGTTLVEGCAYGRGRILRLTRALLPQAFPQLLDPGFPLQLRRLLTSTPEPARVRAVDLAPATGGPVFTPVPRELQPWLLVLIVLTFLVERWMASAPRARVAP